MSLDPNRWVSTLPRAHKSNSVKIYSLIAIMFVTGLIFVSVIKNETKNLEKEISNLLVSINTLKLDLYQATLDHEVITSPENVSRLAKQYLETNLAFYEKSQIKQLNKRGKISVKSEKTKFKKSIWKKPENKIKLIFAKKIKTKKTELVKLQELYSNPEEIPKELRLQVVKKIETKKNELNELKRVYSDPESIFKSKKMQRWAGLQIVKVFLGIPIVPGK